MGSSIQESLATGKYRTRITAVLGVETAGADEQIEIPMIVGVLSDLSGSKARAEALDDRKPIEINAENFSRVMKGLAPEVEVTVPNLPQTVKLTFTHMDDFSPERIAETVPELRTLLAMRKKLRELENKIDGKPATERAIGAMLEDLKKEHLK
jgi:type VI secretion system protein ImpB